jgi:hypothetical protein
MDMSLHRFLEDKRKGNQIVNTTQMFVISKSVAEGLNYLHERGEGIIIHRKCCVFVCVLCVRAFLGK